MLLKDLTIVSRAVAGQAPQVSQDEALVAASQAAVDKPRHDFSDGVIAGSVAFAAGTTGDDKLDFKRTGKEAANLHDILDSGYVHVDHHAR